MPSSTDSLKIPKLLQKCCETESQYRKYLSTIKACISNTSKFDHKFFHRRPYRKSKVGFEILQQISSGKVFFAICFIISLLKISILLRRKKRVLLVE
jgi:hypothetical protein